MCPQVAEDQLSNPIASGFLSGPYVITYSRIAMAFGAFQVVLGCFILWRATQARRERGSVLRAVSSSLLV